MSEEKHFLVRASEILAPMTFETLDDSLAQKLGYAVWNFSRIEWLTYEYLAHLGGDDCYLHYCERPFVYRIAGIREVVRGMGASQRLIAMAEQLLDKAKRLADRRNILVHNPWQIKFDFEKNNHSSAIRKHLDANKQITESDIEQFSFEAEMTAFSLENTLKLLVACPRWGEE